MTEVTLVISDLTAVSWRKRNPVRAIDPIINLKSEI